MFNIERKRTLITGAASGIGRVLALQLAKKKAHLCLVDIQADLLEETAALCRESGVFVHTIVADLSQEDAIISAAKQAGAELGGLDILINNAGLVYYGPTEKMTDAQREQLLAVNLLAPIRLTDACFEMLLANRSSRIVNISSMFGLVPSNRNTIYHATKYGLTGYSLALRTEFAKYGLGVSTICPGFVRTSLFDNMLLPEGSKKREPPWWISTSPNVIAKKTIRAIERNRRLVTITSLAKICFAAERICPWLCDTIYQLQKKRPHDFALQEESKVPFETRNKNSI